MTMRRKATPVVLMASLALVVAESLDAARQAAERAVIEIDEEEPILDIATALAKLRRAFAAAV